MRYSKLPRRLIVAAVVLLGVATVGDVVALQVAESQAGAGFARATAAERAEVTLGGFPFLPRLLTGRVATVEVRGTGLAGGGLRVASVQARVEDVRFSTGDAISLIRSPYAERAKISVSSPFGKLEIAEQDLSEFLRRRFDALQGVRISPAGVEVRFDVGQPEPAVARFLPRVENRRLVLRLVGQSDLPRGLVDQARQIEDAMDLPQIPEGLRVDVALSNGAIELEGVGASLTMLVGEGGVSPA